MKTLLLSCIAFLTACGSDVEQSQSKIVIGSNDLKYHIEDDYISQAIGNMKLGCTVTHIGNGLVITAGHCLNNNSCRGSDYDVTWNHRSNNKFGDFRSSCVEVVAREFDYGLRDYALLRYEKTPEAYLELNSEDRPKIGDKLTIFSHPKRAPLSWSGWCKHEGEHSAGDRFEYTCDTKAGSSGAAILNENYEVVGVHNQGMSYYQVNAGTYVADIPTFKK